MTVAYSDYAGQVGIRPMWRMRITAKEVSSYTRTMEFSDVTHITNDASTITQWLGGVSEWDTMYSGASGIHERNYTQTDVRIRINNIRPIGTMPAGIDPSPAGHNLLDSMTAWYFIGATVQIWQSFGEFDLVDLTSTDISSARFVGTVYDVSEITRYGVTLRARADVASDIYSLVYLYLGLYPNSLARDRDGVVPRIYGQIGYHIDEWKDVMNTSASITEADWKLLHIIDGASPMLAQDVSNRRLRAAGKEIEFLGTTTAIEGAFMRWNDSTAAKLPHGIYQLASGNYTEASGYVTIPLAAGTEGSDPTSSDVMISRLLYPYGDETKVGGSAGVWTNPANMVDGSPETYAEVTNATSELGYANNTDWMLADPYAGTNYTVNWLPSEGMPAKLVALIYHSSSAQTTMLKLRYNSGGTTLSNTFTGFTGWAVKTVAITDAAWSGLATSSNASDGIFINMTAADPAYTLRVAMFGMHMTRNPVASSILFVPSDSTGSTPYYGISNRAEPTYWYVGYGGSRGSVTFWDAVEDLIADETAATTADIDNTASPAFGSFATAETDAANTVGSIIELNDIPVADMLEKCSEAMFCRIWRSPQTGKYRVRVKDVDPTADGQVLYQRNIIADSLVASYSDLGGIYNAVYYDYAYDPYSRQYKREVYIDNSTLQSADHNGARDTTREGKATTSQSLYGRRVLRVRTTYVRDPYTAWNATFRMFDLLKDQRVEIRFDTGFWAADLEPCYVFTTDSTLDNIMRFPGYVAGLTVGQETEPSWSGKLWWVTNITEKPYGAFTVEAINVDSL